MAEAYICDFVRTPIGRYGGALSSVRPDDLAASLFKAVLNDAPSLDPAAIDAFNDRLRDHGHWVLAAGIGAPDTATVIDDRGGAGATSPGSLTDDRDHYSGFWIIDVPDKERALALAAAGSRACNRRVELRPFLGE